MPFDNAPHQTPPTLSLYQRLKILRELLPKTSQSQEFYRSCLWSAARENERLLAIGLSGDREPTEEDLSLFGPYGDWLFSSADRHVKMTVLDETLRHMKAELDFCCRVSSLHQKHFRWVITISRCQRKT